MIKKILGHHSCYDSSSFVRNLLCRIHSLWLIKAIGVMGGITLFFVGYFHFQAHQYFTITPLYFSDIDMLIPFHISFLYIYLSLWIYIGLTPNLMKNFKELLFYGFYALLLGAIGMLFYAFYPTIVVQNIELWKGIPEMMELKKSDNGGNAFPSLHVAFALFGSIWLREQLIQMKAPLIFYIISGLWAAGIIYSTLAIKQHLIIDAVAGIVLGGLVGWISIMHYKKRLRALRN